MSSGSPSYITKNRLGIYLLQIRVPHHIRITNPDAKALIQRSLRTRNKRDALRKARKLVVWMEENNFDIDKIEREMNREIELFHVGMPLFEKLNLLWTDRDIIVIDSFFEQLSYHEEEALKYVAELSNHYMDQLDELLISGDLLNITKFLIDLPRIFKKSAQDKLALHKASSKHPPCPSQPTSPPPPSRSIKDVKLDSAYSTWAEKHQPPAMKASSYQEFKRMISFFVRIINHINHNSMPHISELTIDMIGEYKNILENIPKGIRTKGTPIEDLLKYTGESNSPTTIKNTLGNVGHFIKWLSGEGYPLQPNIYDVLTHHRKIKAIEKKKRVPLDDQDLKALFNSDNYHHGKWERASEFWVPLIALFTGMTRNEIVQLEVADIYEKSSIFVIDVNDRGDKQLKVSASENDEESATTGRARIIPIHSKLIEFGLINFVEYQKSNGQKKLFPCEPRNPRGHFGAYGNRFRSYRIKVGVGPRDDKELRDFHSFRHLVKTKLREVIKDEGLIDDILGHTSKNRSVAGMVYDHSERIGFKADAINRLEYDSIDFNSICEWKLNLFAQN